MISFEKKNSLKKTEIAQRISTTDGYLLSKFVSFIIQICLPINRLDAVFSQLNSFSSDEMKLCESEYFLLFLHTWSKSCANVNEFLTSI